MIVTTKIVETFLMELTTAEKQWLSTITQNPIALDESPHDRDMRSRFWEALNPPKIAQALK